MKSGRWRPQPAPAGGGAPKTVFKGISTQTKETFAVPDPTVT